MKRLLILTLFAAVGVFALAVERAAAVPTAPIAPADFQAIESPTAGNVLVTVPTVSPSGSTDTMPFDFVPQAPVIGDVDNTAFFEFSPPNAAVNVTSIAKFSLAAIPAGAVGINSATLSFSPIAGSSAPGGPSGMVDAFGYNTTGAAIVGADFGMGVTGSDSGPVGGGATSFDVSTAVTNAFNAASSHVGFEFLPTIAGTQLQLSGLSLVIDYIPPNNPPENVTANPDPAVFNAGNVNAGIGLTGTGSDPDSDPITFSWDSNGTFFSNNQNPTMSLADSQLTQPGDSKIVTLAVSDGMAPDVTDTLTTSYTNAAPSAQAGDNLEFSYNTSSKNTVNASVNDADLQANAQVNGFESLSYTWDHGTPDSTSTPATHSNSQFNISDSISFDDAVAAGMTSTTASGTVNLTITQEHGNAVNVSDSLMVTYNNADTTIDNATEMDIVGGKEYSVTYTDNDLDVENVSGAAPNNFEQVGWEFNTEADGSGTTLASGTRNLLDPAQNTETLQLTEQEIADLIAAGDLGVFFLVDDLAGGGNDPSLARFPFPGTVVPEPATIAIWTLLGFIAVGYGAARRRRRG